MKTVERPSPEVMNNVCDVLTEHGINIPQGHVELVSASLLHWLTKYERGHEFMASCLKLRAAKASHEFEYSYFNPETKLTETLRPEKLIFLSGVVYKGEAIAPEKLKCEEIDPEKCDVCSASTVCTQNVEDQFICSNCLSLQEDSKLRDKVELDCSKCTFHKCPWNPMHEAPQFAGIL